MPSPHVIIIGFGVPGRAVAELLHFSEIPYVVIEKNPTTVHRCEKGGEHILAGDALEDDTLRRAGIDRASLVVVAVPDEKLSVQITERAHRLNPQAKIVTRVHYISTGFAAKKVGAAEFVASEQCVADVMRSLVSPMLAESTPSH